MPLLSIILVNYRVPHFLEQCLLSVRKASVGMSVEVIVVDNASGDGSVEWLTPRFPEVRFIESDQNLGFAKASNLGYRQSQGDYVLFLNPDTLLSEDSLHGSIKFLEDKLTAGALGMRMIDGSGRFLRESKRAFPDPATAFYKIIGLSSLFPQSSRFAKYHLGHLSPDSNHPIDVVSGAYFMVRRSVLEAVGSFDEDFFMYGEDIDLSYRIQQAGFINYYYAGSTILHFKGESTQKQSFRYVKLFYGAMSRFVRKHKLHGGLFSVGIQVAIGLRAMLSFLRRAVQQIGIPALDWFLILFTFYGVRYFWSTNIRPEVIYPADLKLQTALIALLFFLVALLLGLQKKPFRWRHFFRSTTLSAAVLLSLYSLLPESFRYSRGIVLFGSLFSIALLAAWRKLLLKSHLLSYFTEERLQFPVLLIGAEPSRRAIQRLYPEASSASIFHLPPEGSVQQLAEQMNGYYSLIPFTDVVFCTDDLSFEQIFMLMKSWGPRFSYRFHTSDSEAILPLRKW